MNNKNNNLDPEILIKQLNQTMLEMRRAVTRLRVCAERSNAALAIQAQQDLTASLSSNNSSKIKAGSAIIVH